MRRSSAVRTPKNGLWTSSEELIARSLQLRGLEKPSFSAILLRFTAKTLKRSARK
jgi:hypothetical protein